MFKSIRDRLLLSYLLVLVAVLGSFALAVRITFARSLNQQLLARLEMLARVATQELELEDDGAIEVDDEVIVSANQAVQWFGMNGNLLGQQGKAVLTLPFTSAEVTQRQQLPAPVQGLTVAVNDYDTGQFIGYARVSESTAELNATLRRFDRGLGGGIALALGLSALGGLWLTRQAMQPIEQSFDRLQRFTADASHELRSPLMAIRANAEVALKYPEAIRAGDRDKFKAIQSAAIQITALTEDLLLLARLDQTKTVQMEAIALASLIEPLLLLYQAQADAKQLQLTANIHDAGALVKGDRSQLNRLLTNLLDNALRYTPKRGQIQIQTEVIGDRIQIQVKDNGIGLTTEQQSQVFERFWQADQARTYQSKGAGLGLAIAEAIAHSHNGSLSVTSQPNQGTCFTLKLPAQ